ncbi:putative transcriptional regulator [Bifidobacterium actinocoloniiforme DSM 22766]|uniref:Putative transcriptional regulator n=1 Tax=Bifidobacterium actinocoloniiforme DSM 22766 TaxID=1437605 RepID=A0A086YYH3_9BIFI|nr:transcriptional regulator [Bifidobacterium actinocoloniiforme]AKV55867.1 hypothetical protein AB656_06600 [Bifidobacterium actinocoloniiforme DSM 22766]KFI39323.1 putative transcriptional regulator [Bifidobacterium actinocoloniiforme DSM 22766]
MEDTIEPPDGAERGQAQVLEDRRFVMTFKPLVEFLGKVYGPMTEVALHDASQPNSSIVAIANGHVSGRGLGAPATDLMLRILGRGEAENRDYLVGYAGHSANSATPLVSSTFFIRRQGRIVGMLCINHDQTALSRLSQAVGEVRQAYFPLSTEMPPAADASTVEAPSSSVPPAVASEFPSSPSRINHASAVGSAAEEENLSLSVEDMAQRVVNEAVSSTGRELSRFSLDERMGVIRELDASGYFLLKGSISSIAGLLDVAESTIYRYLQQSRKR